MLNITKTSACIFYIIVLAFACSRSVTRTEDGGQTFSELNDSAVEVDASATSSNSERGDASSDSEAVNPKDASKDPVDAIDSGPITDPQVGTSGSGGRTNDGDAASGGSSGDTGGSGGVSGSFSIPVVDPGGSALPVEFPQLTCFDQECPDISRLGSPCCTTGNPPYSLEEDRCGTDVSAFASFAGIVEIPFDPMQCLQLYQPGEIDGFCPDLPPIVPILASEQPGCCMQSGYCGSWDTMGPLGCHAISNGESSDPIACRLFVTPQECREVYEERGELDSLQGCICDNCLDSLLVCRHELGCIRIWTCMLESDCRSAADCYLNEISPCREEFERYDAVSLSYALQVSTCVQLNCD